MLGGRALIGTGSRRSPQPPVEQVAALTQRLAVLLAAGVSPVSAWGYLMPMDHVDPGGRSPVSGVGAAGPVIAAAAEAARQGDSVSDALATQARCLPGAEGDAWLALAAAWSVATDAGAPLAGSLRELAASFRHVAQLQRDVDVALAGPAATARMVLALPVVGLGFGALLGFNALHALFATIPGLLCLAAGGALMGAGALWNRRLVRRAQEADAAPGLELDLTAIAMAGGASVARAHALVAAALDRYRPEPLRADRARLPGEASNESTIVRVLELATRAGAPAAELLRSEADQQRRAAATDGQRRAATLAVTLMLPLGLCVLPAFMLLGVAPLLLSLLAGTLSTL